MSEIPHTNNWRSYLSTIASCDSSGALTTYIRKSPANAHHLSTTAITDILDSFGSAITETVADRVRNASEFAVMADECTDINKREMVSLCIRFLEQKKVTEVLIGTWPVQSTSAQEVTECIVKGLQSMSLDPTKIVSVAFDGASNMSGKNAGVQALLKQ